MTAGFDRRVVIALFSVFTLFLVGAAVCIYRVESGTLRGLRAQFATDQARLDDLRQKIDHMPQLEAEHRQLRSRLSFLEEAVPDAEYIPTFLGQIERLGMQTQNEILLIRPKKKQKTVAAAAKSDVKINNETGEVIKDENAAGSKNDPQKAAQPRLPYDFIPIEMKIEGTYYTTLDFLQQLQRFPKMIAVNSVGFQPRATSVLGSATNDQVLTVNLDMMAVAMKGAHHGDQK